MRRWFPRGMRRRWWLFRPFDLLAALVPSRRRGGLLIVRMDGIGDMVLFRPFLDLYVRHAGFAPEEVTILGCKSWGALAETVFAGIRVVAIDEKRFEKSLFYRVRVAVGLRRTGYDTVLCSNHFRKSMMHDSLVLACGARRTVVSNPYLSPKTAREFAWYLAHMTEVVETGAHPTHELVRHRRFVAHLAGAEVAPPPFALPWRDMPPDFAAQGRYAVLNFGSNEPGRNWPLENYIALARALVGMGARVVFVGGAREAARRDQIRAGLAAEAARVIDRVGATTLPELLDILKSAALVVTNETGPGHLSLILGTPTVMIYGGGQARSFMPYPESYRRPTARFVHHEMACYGCLWVCPLRAEARDPFPCVAAVAVGQVLEQARDLLEAGPTAAPGA